jgi:hypothetical protein
MPLHLIKLCVGAESIEDLADWQKKRLAERKRRGEELLLKHVTRQMPKRRAEVIDGGSLYWVIKGWILVRQRIVDLRPTVDGEGIPRCEICYAPELVKVEPRPRGPFQGWRYFVAKEAPADLASLPQGLAEMPEALRRELFQLGVL